MKPMMYLKKTIALFVCATLIPLNNSGYASPERVTLSPPSATLNPSSIILNGVKNLRVTIPSELGTIEESFSGTSGKTIVYIQDAHDSLEAQENIAKIISYLVEKEGIQTVFEEGYEGAVPTGDYFGFIKDPKKDRAGAHEIRDSSWVQCSSFR